MAKEKATTPQRWWQWFLMYPALGIALLGHIPNGIKLYQSYRIGVPYSKVDAALEQSNLWIKNFECVRKMDLHKAMTYCNDCISIGVCESGDVLVRVDPAGPNEKPNMRWVGFSEIKTQSAHASILVASAWAQPAGADMTLAQGGPTVICQRWIGGGLLLQRLRYPDGHCADQTINTYTGAVIKTVPAPCSPEC